MERIDIDGNYLITICYGSGYICYGCTSMAEVYEVFYNNLRELAESAIEYGDYEDFDEEDQLLVQMILQGTVPKNPITIKKCYDILYNDIFGMHFWVTDYIGNTVFRE
jgi:hypothetical protein